MMLLVPLDQKVFAIVWRAIDDRPTAQYHPLHLLNTATGLVRDHETQINAFKLSAELRMEYITEAVET